MASLRRNDGALERKRVYVRLDALSDACAIARHPERRDSMDGIQRLKIPPHAGISATFTYSTAINPLFPGFTPSASSSCSQHPKSKPYDEKFVEVAPHATCLRTTCSPHSNCRPLVASLSRSQLHQFIMVGVALHPRLSRKSILPYSEFDCAVIGIGRLGLCFALTLERVGLKVIGVDMNESYVRKITSKTCLMSQV